MIPLCEFFLQSSVEKLDLCQKRLGRDAQDLLVSYNWPGNARELRNVIEVAALLSRDRSELTKQDFPHLAHFSKETVSSNVRVRLPEDGINLNEFLAEVETDLIRQSLERSEGNKKKAAELLCLKRTTLVEKIRRTGLHADQNAM